MDFERSWSSTVRLIQKKTLNQGTDYFPKISIPPTTFHHVLVYWLFLYTLYVYTFIFIHFPYSSNQALTYVLNKTHIWPRLERLLKDAILHGAKLGRSKKDLEEQLAQQKVEQGRLQRRVMQLTQEVVSPRGRIGWFLKMPMMRDLCWKNAFREKCQNGPGNCNKNLPGCCCCWWCWYWYRFVFLDIMFSEVA